MEIAKRNSFISILERSENFFRGKENKFKAN